MGTVSSLVLLERWWVCHAGDGSPFRIPKYCAYLKMSEVRAQ